jgi:hypothetical protein
MDTPGAVGSAVERRLATLEQQRRAVAAPPTATAATQAAYAEAAADGDDDFRCGVCGAPAGADRASGQPLCMAHRAEADRLAAQPPAG